MKDFTSAILNLLEDSFGSHALTCIRSDWLTEASSNLECLLRVSASHTAMSLIGERWEERILTVWSESSSVSQFASDKRLYASLENLWRNIEDLLRKMKVLAGGALNSEAFNLFCGDFQDEVEKALITSIGQLRRKVDKNMPDTSDENPYFLSRDETKDIVSVFTDLQRLLESAFRPRCTTKDYEQRKSCLIQFLRGYNTEVVAEVQS